MSQRVRPAAVAGMFYPADQATLTAQVDGLLDHATAAPPVPLAILVPHAGYIYSGSTAALAYAQWRGASIDHVIIVGPTHRVGIHAVALPNADALATPLGDVPIWWYDGVTAIRDLPQVAVSEAVHAEEHSLEVQLPFIQRVLPQADVLPLAAGWVTPQAVADVLETLWATPRLGIVISSDLSHYHSYEQAQAIDKTTLAQVLALDATIDHDQACGATGLDAMLLLARQHDLTPRLLGACNSGDTAGNKRHVVGYAAVAFYAQDAS